MHKALILILVAVLAGACAKKSTAPAAQTPGNTTQTNDADKATGGAPDSKDSAPAPVSTDPCEGGEQK
jgi:hypothetical protein